MKQKISFDQIINSIVDRNSISKTFARTLIREFTNLIKQGLLKDNVVNLAGFGIFKLHNVPQRTGRNIQTGEPIVIPAHRKILFKPEKHLRELINKKYENLKATILDDEKPKVAAVKKKDATDSDITLSAIAESLDNMIKEKPESKEKRELTDEPLLKDDILSIEMQEKAVEKENEEEKKSYNKIYIGASLIAILLIILLFTKFGDDEPEKVEIVESEKPVIETVIEKKEEVPVQKVAKVAEKHDIKYKTIKSVKGDNLWDLAYKHYNDGYLWPLILQANKAQISNPDLIEPGVNLQIPNLINPTKLSKEENKILSDGHLTAYFAYKGKKEQDARNHLFVANLYDHENVKKSLAKIDNSDYQSIQNLSMK